MTQIYARIENGKVTNIILAEADFIESGAVGDPSKWIDTTDHKNKPGVGSLHHAELNGFVHTKPYPNWFWSKSEKVEKSEIPKKDYKLLLKRLQIKDIDLDYLIDKHPDFINEELKWFKKEI